MKKYSNCKVKELVGHISGVTGIEETKVCVKAVEEVAIRRLDKLIYNPADPNELATLAHLKIKDNTAILVEEKQGDDQPEEE